MDYSIQLKQGKLEAGELGKLTGLMEEFTRIQQYAITERLKFPVLLIRDANQFDVPEVIKMLKANGYPDVELLSRERYPETGTRTP